MSSGGLLKEILTMTKEDKQLLLKDLCARLPYHPIVSVAYNYADKGIVWEFDVLRIKLLLEIEEEQSWEYIKPYLRPMSSMTEEECIALSKLTPYETDAWKYIKTPVPLYIANIEQFDFFHRHHLDWRGLISKGLAIEAPEGMYK